MKNKLGKIAVCFLFPFLGAIIPSACAAFEQALYSPGASPEATLLLTERLSQHQLTKKVITNYGKWCSLARTAFEPSHSLNIKSLDTIGLDIKSYVQNPDRSGWSTRKQIMDLLRDDQKKDLLVVRFEPGTIFDGKNIKMLADLEPFIGELNFKRVLVIAKAGHDFYVYQDSENKSDAPLYHTGVSRPACFTHPNVLYMQYRDGSELFSVNIGYYREDFVDRSCLSAFLNKDEDKQLIVFHLSKGNGEKTSLKNFAIHLGYKKAEVIQEYNLFQVEPKVVDEQCKQFTDIDPTPFLGPLFKRLFPSLYPLRISSASCFVREIAPRIFVAFGF